MRPLVRNLIKQCWFSVHERHGTKSQGWHEPLPRDHIRHRGPHRRLLHRVVDTGRARDAAYAERDQPI